MVARSACWALLAPLLFACGGRSVAPGGADGDAGRPPGDDAAGVDAGLDAAPEATPCTDTSADPHNCGRCGHDCLGGACAAGQCQPAKLASGHPYEFLAVNSTTLFAGWKDGIEAIALPTGAPVSLGSVYPGGMVADDPDVFWVSDHGLWVARGGVASGIAHLVATDEPLGSYATGIAIDATRVYWFGAMPGAHQGTVHVVGVDGSMPLSLPAPPGFVSSLAADGQALYWFSSTNAFGRMSIPDGTVTPLGQASNIGQGAVGVDELVALDGADFYVAAAPAILSVSKNGGSPASVAATTPPTAIAVDDSDVYWAEFDSMGTSTVMRAPKAGGQPVVIASGQQSTMHIVVDATSIIWANYGPSNDNDGSVMRLAK